MLSRARWPAWSRRLLLAQPAGRRRARRPPSTEPRRCPRACPARAGTARLGSTRRSTLRHAANDTSGALACRPCDGQPGARPAAKRSRAILELLYGTGIRVSECERLDIGDVGLAQGVVFVRDGKGRKDRVVPVLGRAADALDFYLRDARPELVRNPAERAFFLTRHGTRMRAKSIRYLVLMNRKGAEIPLPVTPHGLRHACATHLVKNGADVRHVQKLLGHASLDSTQIYTKVAAADLARMLEKAHPREQAWRRKAARGGRKR